MIVECGNCSDTGRRTDSVLLDRNKDAYTSNTVLDIF